MGIVHRKRKTTDKVPRKTRHKELTHAGYSAIIIKIAETYPAKFVHINEFPGQFVHITNREAQLIGDYCLSEFKISYKTVVRAWRNYQKWKSDGISFENMFKNNKKGKKSLLEQQTDDKDRVKILIQAVEETFRNFDEGTLASCFGHRFSCYNAILEVEGRNDYIPPHDNVREKLAAKLPVNEVKISYARYLELKVIVTNFNWER
jgi:hypothetical protein